MSSSELRVNAVVDVNAIHIDDCIPILASGEDVDMLVDFGKEDTWVR
jgi:hypothetical protein